jgi:hypothetical protein
MTVTINGSGTAVITDSSGNAGIGTATPTQKLEVAGTIYSTSGGFKFPDGTTQTTAGTGIPTGTIITYGSSTTPSGYLRCDGTTYNKSSYTALAAVVGSIPTSSPQYRATFTGYPTYVNSTFIIPNNTNLVSRSTDGGVTWSTATVTTANFSINGIAYVGSNYIGLGQGVGCVFGIWYTSSLSNTTWAQSSLGGLNTYSSIASSGTRAVTSVIGTIASTKYTTDGVTWSNGGTLPNSGYISYSLPSKSAAYGASLFVMGGYASATANPGIYTSPDGLTWTRRTWAGNTSTGSISYVDYVNSQFIAVDSTGNLCTSPDGTTWTFKSLIPTSSGTWQYVVYLASTGLYYYSNGLANASYVSIDLVNWVLVPIAAGSINYVSPYMVTDGTSIVSGGGGTTWKPFPYNTSTQFIVPNAGVLLQGQAPIAGVQYYIKT